MPENAGPIKQLCGFAKAGGEPPNTLRPLRFAEDPEAVQMAAHDFVADAVHGTVMVT